MLGTVPIPSKRHKLMILLKLVKSYIAIMHYLNFTIEVNCLKR